MSPPKWKPEQMTQLKELWNSPYTCEQIARKVGVSGKNAVLGKGFRMKLGPRTKIVHTTATLRPSKEAKPINSACLWPIGHPDEKDFHFCGGDVETNKPYCTTHCNVAFERSSKKEAAA